MRQFIALIFSLISIHIYSQERNYTTDTIQVKSEILKETRSIIIYQSLNTSRTDSVKFIYLIDGEYSNYRFQQIKERFKDSISNLIGGWYC